MKKTVVLSIRGKQTYPQQEPEVIELVTEGTMEFTRESISGPQMSTRMGMTNILKLLE